MPLDNISYISRNLFNPHEIPEKEARLENGKTASFSQQSGMPSHKVII